MKNPKDTRVNRIGAPPAVASQVNKELLNTKELARLTGLSKSYFDKGRIYNYGPNFLRVLASGKTGKILYRLSDVEAWLAAQESVQGVIRHD
jgi:predicted DNA-binding transcriptional regulator AlpA